MRCDKFLAAVPHDAHWHVVRAGGIVFAQGQCEGYATDTRTQDTTHNAKHRYAARVTVDLESPAVRDGLAAIAEIEDLDAKIAAARERRDAAVVACAKEGMRAPEIGRMFKMSTSNVRNALRTAGVGR